MSVIEDVYGTCYKQFKQYIKTPENFVGRDVTLQAHFRKSLLLLYNFVAAQCVVKGVVPKLIPEYDLEQIWQLVELQNDAYLSEAITEVCRVIKLQKDKTLEVHVSYDESVAEPRTCTDVPLAEVSEADDQSCNKDDEIVDEAIAQKDSIVDDTFFKLSEMEEFLEKEEREQHENKSQSGDDDDDEDDEADTDISDIDNKSGASSDDEEIIKMKTAKFEDFFGSKNLANKSNDRDESTRFELRQERLKSKIDELEEKLIAEKPWFLKGEVTADKRPLDSILEEALEYNLATKPAPIITHNTSLQLEAIIRQRIKDKLFDSVERKVKPSDSLAEYKKKIVLDQEKSKHSLAQIYEQEYLKQIDDKNSDPLEKIETVDEVPELHKEIERTMSKLFSKLDALSNFHYTAKQSKPEPKIITNMSTINVEEISSQAVSNAKLLAPEEVHHKPKGATLVGDTERTKTDKKHQRRKKKLKQKIHAKRLAEKHANSISSSTGEAINKRKSKNKHSSSNGAGSNTKSNLTSSKQFFTQLQDQVTHQATRKRPASAQNNNTVKKFKL